MPSKPAPTTEAVESIFTVRKLITWVGKFVGIVGGGGAGIAGLSFGIGYLAIKSHDAMLGLPTTIYTYESYVRTGALFFSNSLYFLIDAVSDYIWKIAVPAMIMVLVISLILSKWSLKSVSKHILVGLIVVYAVINLFALLSTEKLSAVLHQDNRGLLLKFPEEVKHTGYEKKIYDLLCKEDGTADLQRIYSIHLAEAIVFICFAVALSKWRQRIKADSWNIVESTRQSNPQIFLFVCDWLFRPILYTLIIFHLVLLPMNYGVLCLSNEYPRVFLTLKEGTSPKKPGFLLSDMSVDLKEIIWLSKKAKGQLYSFHFFQKKNIKKIEVIVKPGLRNILAVKRSDVTSNK